MDQLFEKNLITTKDAGELSGYTPDYLARLARSGKIIGKRIGHSWFIDKDSLALFLSQQGDRKIDHARALARAREAEYRARHTLSHRVSKTLSKPLSAPFSPARMNAVRSHAVACSAAFAVIAFGAFAAQAAPMAQFTEKAGALARETASGFSLAFGDVPSRIASKITDASREMRAYAPRVARDTARVTSRIASPQLVAFDFSSVSMSSFENQEVRHPRLPSMSDFQNATSSPIAFFFDARSFAHEMLALVSSPSRIPQALVAQYRALGVAGYDASLSSLAAYARVIRSAGASSLTLAAASRDTLATAPQLAARTHLAFGETVIDMSHTAIRGEAASAYSLSQAIPASGRAAIALLADTGGLLAAVAARTPALATAAFLRATEAPALAAPAIARAIFSAQYAGAKRFVAFTGSVSQEYLALVSGTGHVAYTGVTTLKEVSSVWKSDIDGCRGCLTSSTGFTTALENAYLGALGKGALALETLGNSRLANTAPALALRSLSGEGFSVGEQVALTTYRTLNTFFASTSRALATLVAPPPTIVLPDTSRRSTRSTAPEARTAVIAPPVRQTVNSYPTYTTMVRGISEDLMSQSLASLRTDILATVSGMIQPVSRQVVTNSTTIQQVNMIQKLDGLTVTNGTFRGGIFEEGIRVAATNGNFTNFSAGTAHITGDLAVTGALSSDTSATAPYFTATTTADNTFPNLISTNSTTTNSTSTNLYSSSLIASNATSTNFFATLGHFTTGVIDTLSSTFATLTNASTTRLSVADSLWIGGNATTTADGTFTTNGNISINGTSSLVGLTTFQNGFLSNASSTINSGLFSMNGGASTTALTVSGQANIGSLELTTALPVTSGGTGWQAILAGSIPYGNGIGALATTTAAADGNILAWLNGIPAPLATSTIANGSGISVTGTGALVNAGGLTITNTGVLSLQQLGGGSAQTGALTIATSTVTANGQTLGIAVTNSAGAFTFTPTISGTLDNTGLTNSTISGVALGGTLASLTATDGTLTFSDTYTGATARTVGLNLGNENIWTALQQFNANASTTQLTTTGSTYLATTGGKVSIGTATSDVSAVLDITSTTGGILPPRLTTAQKTAISSPAAGLTLYDSTLNKLNVYNGSAWKNVGSTEIGGEVTNGVLGSVLFIGDGALLAQDSANFNYSTSTGRLGLGTSTPFAQLSIAGSAGGTTNLFAISTSTSGFATTTAITIDQNGNLALLNGTNLSVGGALSASSASFTNALPITSGGTGEVSFASDQLHYGNFSTVATSTPTFNLGLTSGGTWSVLGSSPSLTIATSSLYTGAANALPYFTGTNTLGSINAGTNGYILGMSGGTPTWLATTTFSSGLAYANGNVTNTGLLSLQQLGGGAAQTGALTIATSSDTNILLNITNTGGAFTFTPSWSGTLADERIASAATWNAKQAALSFTYPLTNVADTISLAFGTSTSNTWGDTQTFTNAPSIASFTGLIAANGGATYQTATSSLTLGLGLSGSNMGYLIGGSSPSLTIATSSLYTGVTGGLSYFSGTNTLSSLAIGTGGYVLTSVGGLPSWAATSTIGVQGRGNGVANQIAYWTDANTISSSANYLFNPTTNLLTVTGNASTTQLTTTGSTYLATTGGNVGIGTTGPGYKLQIVASSVSSGISGNAMFGNEGGNIILGAGTATADTAYGNYIASRNSADTAYQGLGIKTSTGVPKFWIDTSGNVGIGTTTPGHNLEIGNSGNVYLALNSDTDGNYEVATKYNNFNTGTNWWWTGINNEDDYSIAYGSELSAANTKLFVQTGGNVGIGTTTPSGKLAVSGGASIGADYNFAPPTNGLIIQGNVGIGTSTPSQLLHIYGSNAAMTVDNSNTAGSSAITLRENNSLTGGLVSYGSTHASAANQMWFKNYKTEGMYFSTGTAGSGGTIANMIIDTDGKVLMGAATSRSIFGATRKVQIEGTETTLAGLSLISNNSAYGAGMFFGRSTGTTVGSVTTVANGDSLGGLYWSGADGSDLDSQAASIRVLVDGTVAGNQVPGALIFSTNVVGGTTVSERMRIDNTGNVGIGTTAPGKTLDVNGDIRGSVVTGSTGFLGGYFDVSGYGSIGTTRTLGWYLRSQMTSPADGDLTITNNAGTVTPFVIKSGNVGIGTTNPLAKLEISQASDSNGLILSNSSVGNLKGWLLYNHTNGSATDLRLYEQTVGDKVTFQAGGNVGIGTSTPSSLLDVYSATAAVHGFSGGATKGKWTMGYDVTNNLFAIASSSSITSNVRMVINNDGNVGIGTTNPGRKLDVVDSGAGQRIVSHFINTDYTAGNIAYLDVNQQVGVGSSYHGYFGVDTAGRIRINADSLTEDDFVMDLNGNVGIGTTNPVQPLHVAATSALPATSGTTQTGGIRIVAGATGAQVLDMGVYNTTGAAWLQSTTRTDLSQNFALLLNPNGGNVGIGTTTPSGKLAVSGGASIGADYNFAPPTNGLIIQGNVGIGTTSPATKLEVGGNTANVTFDGYLNCSGFTSDANGKLACTASDERLKQNIVPMSATSSLAALGALNPVAFNWRDTALGTQEQFGLIAQEVQGVFPNLVQATNATELTPGGTLTVNYTGLIAPMIRSIQELDARLRQLQAATGALSTEPGVESQCVVGDTKLRRRKKGSRNEPQPRHGGDAFEEIEIKNIVVGDEIAALDECAGKVVYSRVNALMNMGVQEVFELRTASGRVIRTTGNHPYLVREAQKSV